MTDLYKLLNILQKQFYASVASGMQTAIILFFFQVHQSVFKLIRLVDD